MGSPLYAHLLRRGAADVEADGPVWRVLSAHVAPGRGDAVALRLMAAVHRLVLTGQAPSLAACYPSVGGRPEEDEAWKAFRGLLAEREAEVRTLISLPCQTNEVGRCAPLAFGFFDIASRTELPFRLLEVGASAGLNLRWDRFHYGGGGAEWGDPASPVDLGGFWSDPPPSTRPITVIERLGCDRRPLDPTREDDRLALRASVWADQVGRFERLRGALDLAARVPATLEAASLEQWLPDRLAEPREGVVTVVYHSVVAEYLPAEARRRFEETIAEAGSRATPGAPLAWVRLEPVSALRSHGVTATFWPGGGERMLATSGAHGTNVVRVASG